MQLLLLIYANRYEVHCRITLSFAAVVSIFAMCSSPYLVFQQGVCKFFHLRN